VQYIEIMYIAHSLLADKDLQVVSTVVGGTGIVWGADEGRTHTGSEAATVVCAVQRLAVEEGKEAH
jgi:hypothetical protein